MRVVHVIASLDPAHGGPPIIATRLAAAQAGAGHDVHLVYYDPTDPAQRPNKALETVPGFANVRLHPLPPPGRVERVVAPAARAKVRALMEEPCFVHLHGVWEGILRVAAAEARRMGRPYFILLNGMLDPWSLAQRAAKKRVALMLGYRQMLNGAAGLHVGNEDEQRLIEPLRLRPRSYVIPNGVFLEELEPLPPVGSFFGAHPELAGRRYVLFLSRIHYKKGLDYLADAFAQVAARYAEVLLVVAGPDGGERAAFEQRVAALNLGDRVILPGPLYGTAKLAALVDAACFCLPSRQEGFSMAITEALACGVPAVVSENCHFPEVATAGAGAVVPLDARAIAAAIDRLLADPAARRAAGEAGRRLVAAKYTWPRIAEQSAIMYEDAHRAQANRPS